MRTKLSFVLLVLLITLMGVSSAPGADVIRTGTNYVCTGPVDIDTLRVTDPGGTRDALVLAQNCSGVIDRIELSGPMADGIKVQNAGTVAHDLTIGGGYVWCGQAAGGVHQDGIQVMGGRNITFSNLVIDCLGGGAGNYFVARGGSGASTPTNITLDHGALGPRHPNQILVPSGYSVNSVIQNTLVCEPTSGRGVNFGASTGSGNIVVPSNDPRCSFEGLVAYTGGSAPPPPPPPPPEETCDQACVDEYEARIAELEAEVADLLALIAQIRDLVTF